MIEIKNISKYYGEQLIIKDLTFKFKDVGLYYISGESGVGKTTLLRIIAGLEKIDTGAVITPKTVSFSFQEYRLFPWLNLLDNVAIVFEGKASGADIELAKEMLYRLGFLESDLKKRPNELSGGMKQRASVARAALSDSECIILDEPTKELDQELVEAVYNLMKELSENRLVIFTSHSTPPLDLPITGELHLERQQ